MTNSDIVIAILVIVGVVVGGAFLCLLALMFIDEDISPRP